MPTIDQGGNSFGGPMIIGTIDANQINFLANNLPVSSILQNGYYYGPGIAYSGGSSNSRVNTNVVGTFITRNIADINAALTVNQQHQNSTGKTLVLQKAGSEQLSMSSTGDLKVTNLAGTGTRMVTADNTGVLSANTEVLSGTYIPTITGSASTYIGQGFRYTKIGDIVHVSGNIVVSGGFTGQESIKVSIPIASNFTNDYDASGVVSGKYVGAPASSSDLGNYIVADTSADNIYVYYFSLDSQNRVFVEFTYLIQ
jgi:hypothetical protein